MYSVNMTQAPDKSRLRAIPRHGHKLADYTQGGWNKLREA